MARRISKQNFKRIEKHCKICGEDNYNLLDVHRLIAGEEGGDYTLGNSIVLCCRCHRRVHAGEIIIEGKYKSTTGFVIHYFEGEQEFWK